MAKIKINEDVLSQSDLNLLANELSNISINDIMVSQQALRNFIQSGLTLIKAIELPQSNEELEKAIVHLFKIIIDLRTYFTGEVYILNVETQNQGTIEVDLNTLFQEQAILLNSTTIEYNLDLLKTQLNQINIHQKLYDNLINRLFTQCHSTNMQTDFIYMHTKRSKEQNKGHFFDKHFAHYRTLGVGSFAHFFIDNPFQDSVIYDKNTAKFYNRGHVYEWYIDDLNKKDFSNRTRIDPVAFMRAHKKDTVPFLAAGDITRQKDNQIQAVQIKRFNNHKLVTCKQVRTVLNRLYELTSKGLTKQKASDIIVKAFLGGTRQAKKVHQSTKQHIESILNNDIMQNFYKNNNIN